jgi:hypothetical protein
VIDETILHYKIFEKLGEGGMSPACQRNSASAGRQNGPRTHYVSGCRFEDPTERSAAGGVRC